MYAVAGAPRPQSKHSHSGTVKPVLHNCRAHHQLACSSNRGSLCTRKPSGIIWKSLDGQVILAFQVNMDIVGSFRTSIGRKLFGQCINKFSGSFPMKARGKARGHAFAKVLVSSVRLEVRPTASTPVLGNIFNVTIGEERPHLVFNFNVRLDGTLHSLDISHLKLTGCEIKFLGIKMFSVCGLIEKVVKKQIEKVTESSFPLRGGPFLREIERAIKMQVGQEVAIPLVLRDGANLDPANRAISKTQRLIQLNVELFHALIALTKDMEKAKAEEEKAPEA